MSAVWGNADGIELTTEWPVLAEAVEKSPIGVGRLFSIPFPKTEFNDNNGLARIIHGAP